jgi:hypothetical protein
MLGILDSQLMQAKGVPYLVEFGRCRILQGHPNKRIRTGDKVADVADRNVGN